MDGIEPQVEVSSRVDANASDVWARATTAEGVNYEMEPWLRFVPPEDPHVIEAASEGEKVRLKIKGPLGLPLGHYPLQIKEIEEGTRFLEQTRMLPFLLWQHERTIEQKDGHSIVTDRLGWFWKPTFLDPLVRVGVRAFFNHRHRRLRHGSQVS